MKAVDDDNRRTVHNIENVLSNETNLEAKIERKSQAVKSDFLERLEALLVALQLDSFLLDLGLQVGLIRSHVLDVVNRPAVVIVDRLHRRPDGPLNLNQLKLRNQIFSKSKVRTKLYPQFRTTNP